MTPPAGKQPSPAEETQALRQAIREAHECLKDLNQAIREARTLSNTMIGEFEKIHEREIAQLSNWIAAETNRIAAVLNTEVRDAKKSITDRIMAGEARFDSSTRSVIITWDGSQFDEHQPLPYPNKQTPETHP